MKEKIVKKNNKRKHTQRGFGLVEILVATAVISASVVGLAAVVQLSFRAAGESFVKTKAEFLAEEGIEVVRLLRDQSWASNIETATSITTYYPVFATTTSVWSLSTSNPGLIDSVYTREIIFDDVYRSDADDDIVASTSPESKTLDPGTRQITSRVVWEDSSTQFVTYIADIFGN